MNCIQCGTELKSDASFCPHCGSKVAAATPLSTANKNLLPSAASVSGKREMSGTAKGVYVSIAILLIAAMGIVFVKNLPGGEHPVISNQPTVSQATTYDGAKLTMTPIFAKTENGFIIIALSDVLEKKMVAFTYEGKTTRVDMMAYINPEGKLVTSIAICEPCNSKSFHTESRELVCDNCGTRWNFSTLEGVSGSCQKYPPDPIPSQIVGNEVRISERLVENWKLRI